jgi:hypothetical protein
MYQQRGATTGFHFVEATFKASRAARLAASHSTEQIKASGRWPLK